MKKTIITTAVLVALLSNCSVQQFPVNTKTQPFAHGGNAFGEQTRNQNFKKRRDFFVVGINVVHPSTEQMAKDINATAYTIETKANFFTYLVNYGTFGVLNYKIVKVIKRDN